VARGAEHRAARAVTFDVPAAVNDLDRLRGVWGELGREDPLWAVLSSPDKKGGRWDVDEFFATGRLEIDDHVGALAAMGLPRVRARAVDFGCGAGRLSQALAGHFEETIGVDVSPSMIATARALGAQVANLRFIENATARLPMIEDASVDFVYSNMTLQHIPTVLAEGYVEEFLRVLAPGGVASFQFVGGPDASLRGRLYAALPNRWLNPLRRVLWRRSAVFEMHALDESRLHAMLARHPDMRLAIAMEDRAAGAGWTGRRWIVARD